MRLLGIDFGTKKVGVALTDADGRMAFPHIVLSNDAALLPALLELIEREGVARVVMGESRNYKGAPNPVMTEARAFAEKLAASGNVELVFEPETLTTKEAERIQGPSELTDASAAALILQSHLDHHGKS